MHAPAAERNALHHGAGALNGVAKARCEKERAATWRWRRREGARARAPLQGVCAQCECPTHGRAREREAARPRGAEARGASAPQRRRHPCVVTQRQTDLTVFQQRFLRGACTLWTSLRSTSSAALSKTWASPWSRRLQCLPAVARTTGWCVRWSRPSRLSCSLGGAQTVCRHWLRGLCMKGNACGFLHQFEASRMPVCRFFAKYSECKVRITAQQVHSSPLSRVPLLRSLTARSSTRATTSRCVGALWRRLFRADARRAALAGLQHVQAGLLHSRPKLARLAPRGLGCTHFWSPLACSRFRHLKQAGPAPSPEQAHLIVTRPGRPGSEVLQRGWGGS